MQISSDSRRAQQDIDRLRREIQTLRTQLGQTSGASNTATEAVDRLGDESAQTARQVRNLGEAQNRATGGAQVFTRSLGSLGGVLGGLGLVAAGAGVLRVGANSVEASVKVEGFRNSLTALYGDAQIANTVLARLQELSLLPGITFESAVQGAVRLKTVGVEGERAEGVIREFGNAAALAGATTDEVGRSLVGLTQILSRGKISQEELNQILENLPLIGNSIRESFGSIDAEVIRDQLDAAGQSVQDFADILVNQLSMGARASADSTRNAFSNLENATFRLHAAIGDRLSPSVREATGFLTDLANTAADFVAGTNDATRSANSYADALMMASTAAAVNSAIQERIKFLEQERAGLEAAAAGSANYFEIRGRERDAGRQYREAGEELDVLRTALGNTAAATEHFQGVQNELLETQQGITQEIIRLEAQRAGETARAYGQTTQDIREQREALAETQEQIGENAVVLRALASANTVTAESTSDTTEAVINQGLEIARLQAVVEEARDALSNTIDPNQVEANFETATRSSDAYFAALIASTQAALESSETSAEKRQQLEVRLFELQRQQTQARASLEDEVTSIAERNAEMQAESVERVTARRIESAERARAAEVATFTAAAVSGREYAEQLNQLATVGQRQAFIEIVERFQAQGLSLEEARERAEPYLEVIRAMPAGLTEADIAFDSFTSNLVSGANESADAVLNLMRAVNALGTSIATRLPDARGALERSAQREVDFFRRNPIGNRTIESDQQEAGQQGRDFVNALFRRQDREAERAAIEVQRESIQLYNDLSDAAVDFTSSLIDLQEETNLADRGFQDLLGTFGRLATGDFTALLDIPIQLLNLSRQAAAEREQGARDRSSLYEEQFGDFSRFGRNLSTVSGVLGIPESPELRDSFFFDQAGEFENVLAQSTADFSDGIKNALLSSVVNLERDIRPEDIAEIFQSSIDALGENLDQSQFNLNFDQQLGRDTADAYQSLINDTTTFYQAQIDAINLVRQATGNLSFGDPEALARQAQAETNQLRLAAPPSGPQNAQQFLAASNRTRGLTEPTDDQERGLTSAEVARVDDEVLAAALQANQESIAAINTAIAGLDASISQSNDPAEIEQLLQQIAIQIPERYRLLREALQQQLDAGEITQGEFDTSIEQLGIDESAAIERNSDAMLANALLINRQAIEAINVQVAGLEQAITTSNDPAEITQLLQQLAQQIPEIYRLRKNALSQQFAAGEITLSEFNNSLASLGIEQSAALERNSDAQLANTLLINQTTQTAIATEVSALQQAITASNDPEEIANLLQQIAAQIPETYRLKRNALSAQFAAGEITAEQFQNGYGALETEQAAEVERNSDAQLSNALQVNQSAQTAIHTEISALEQAITTSNDPAEIAMLLMQIAEQIPEKYRLKREALQAQFDANEITIEQLQNGLAALDIEQAAEFERNSDAILANALSDHNADVVIISNAIHSVSEEIRNSDDPAEIAQLVDSLGFIIMEKFRLQREFLQKRLDAEEITVKEYQGQLGRLDIQESDEIGDAETLGESRIETITRPAPSVSQRSTRRGGGGTDPAQAAQRAADEALANALRANQDAQDTISVEVSALENAISESNDPTEITGLLMQIAEQIPETYRLRKEALQTQFDAGKITQAQLDNGLAALDIEQSAMIERNSDAQLANALRINSEAAAAISADVSALENQIAQSNDPAEIASLLTQIAAQIPETYRLRREALQKQYDAGEITLSALNTGLSQLNIEQSAALEQNSDAMLANALSINQQAAEAINTHIAGLENRISQSNDPAEIASLLQQIATQIPEIYRLRREALQRQFDAGEITRQALETGLAQANIDESAALEQNSDAQLANTLSVLSTNAQVVNNSITSLSEQIRNSTDPAEIATLVVDLQNAVMEKYRLQREVLQKQLDAEEITIGDFNAQLGSINLSETSELTSAAALGGAETDDLRRTSNALLQNAIQRAQENLTGATSEEDFETRRQELLRFIEEYYDAEKARIDALMPL